MKQDERISYYYNQLLNIDFKSYLNKKVLRFYFQKNNIKIIKDIKQVPIESFFSFEEIKSLNITDIKIILDQIFKELTIQNIFNYLGYNNNLFYFDISGKSLKNEHCTQAAAFLLKEKIKLFDLSKINIILDDYFLFLNSFTSEDLKLNKNGLNFICPEKLRIEKKIKIKNEKLKIINRNYNYFAYKKYGQIINNQDYSFNINEWKNNLKLLYTNQTILFNNTLEETFELNLDFWKSMNNFKKINKNEIIFEKINYNDLLKITNNENKFKINTFKTMKYLINLENKYDFKCFEILNYPMLNFESIYYSFSDILLNPEWIIIQNEK